jgi:cytochrome c biogenesis protein CcmG/thiol:disulfide interchange protein DsbE
MTPDKLFHTDKRFWYAWIAVAVVLGGMWILMSRVPESPGGVTREGLETAPRKGFLAPDFSLTTLDGATVQLSDLRGRPVLINFWASWCGPCRAEMPHIKAAYETHSGDGLIVLGIDQLESPPQVARFVEEFDLTFPILLDRDGKVSEAYQARALPTSFFVDANGIIRDAFTGPMTAGLIESKLELILSKSAQGSEG